MTRASVSTPALQSNPIGDKRPLVPYMMEFSRNEKAAILDALNGIILDENTQDLNLVDAFTGRQLRQGRQRRAA